MLIGKVIFKIFIPYSHSLKEKRSVIKSLMTRLKNKFNVSIAEIDQNDQWQIAVIGIAMVSNSMPVLDKHLQELINTVDNNNEYEIVDIQREII